MQTERGGEWEEEADKEILPETCRGREIETDRQAAREAARDQEKWWGREKKTDRHPSSDRRTALAKGNLKCKYWKTIMHSSMKHREREGEIQRESGGKKVKGWLEGREKKSDREGNASTSQSLRWWGRRTHVVMESAQLSRESYTLIWGHSPTERENTSHDKDNLSFHHTLFSSGSGTVKTGCKPACQPKRLPAMHAVKDDCSKLSTLPV